VTWQNYETGLEVRLIFPHSRVHRGAYRAQPSRRVYIPKVRSCWLDEATERQPIRFPPSVAPDTPGGGSLKAAPAGAAFLLRIWM
jgi:hypothetical protein